MELLNEHHESRVGEAKKALQAQNDDLTRLLEEANARVEIAVNALQSLAKEHEWTISIVDESLTNDFDEMFELKRESKTRPIKTSMNEARLALAEINGSGK